LLLLACADLISYTLKKDKITTKVFRGFTKKNPENYFEDYIYTQIHPDHNYFPII